MHRKAQSAECTAADKQQPRKSGVQSGDLLFSRKSYYMILEIIGKGNFCKVAKGVNLCTKQDVAVKIFKSDTTEITKREIYMMEVLSVLDPVKTNVVHFYENFQERGQTCLVFEKLDRNLDQLLSHGRKRPLSVSEIRPILHQLLTTLEALRGLGVIHCDLKPDNVMLVNHQNEPFRIKLIDFGLSLRTSEVRHGMVMQPMGYRAPEVSLGLPISGAIDLWGLGCLLSLLYLRKHLFSIYCQYQMMRSMVNVLGKPDDHLLKAGIYTRRFFKENQPWENSKWTLKSPLAFWQQTGIEPKKMWQTVSSLDDLETVYPEIQEPIEMIDQRAFVTLLKLLLQMDPELRITAAEALQHPFVTMRHIEEEPDTSLYVSGAFNKMIVCQIDDSKDYSEVSVSPLCGEGITNMPASPGEILPIKIDDSQEETADDEAEEEVQVVSTTSTRAYKGSTNLPEGAAASGAEGAEAVNQVEDAISRYLPVEMMAPDGSPDVRKKKSPFQSISLFFSRTSRTLFRKRFLENESDTMKKRKIASKVKSDQKK